MSHLNCLHVLMYVLLYVHDYLADGEVGNWRSGKLAKWVIGEVGNWRRGKLAQWDFGEVGFWRSEMRPY